MQVDDRKAEELYSIVLSPFFKGIIMEDLVVSFRRFTELIEKRMKIHRSFRLELNAERQRTTQLKNKRKATESGEY